MATINPGPETSITMITLAEISLEQRGVVGDAMLLVQQCLSDKSVSLSFGGPDCSVSVFLDHHDVSLLVDALARAVHYSSSITQIEEGAEG